MKQKEKLETMIRTLKRIAKMMGTYNRSPQQHAENTIEENQVLAILALQKIGEKTEQTQMNEKQIQKIAEKRELHKILEGD